jgi:membrane protein YdbS with pleckstrin-like domain
MLHDQLSKQLKEGETLVKLVRRDVLASLPAFTATALLILVDFFLLAWLVRHGSWGVAGFIGLLLVALVVGLRTLVEWQLNSLLITNERIIHVHQRGFFTRMVTETTYDKVTDVRSIVTGPLQTALNLGTVEVQTAGEGENLRLVGVRRPPEVQALLTNILRTTKQDNATPLTAQELVDALTKAKEQLGSAAFNDVISRVTPSDERSTRPRS